MLKLKYVKTYYGANPYIDKKAMIFEVEHDLKLNQSNIKRRLIEINDELPIDFDPFDLSEATSHINYISHLALQLLNYIRGDLRFSFTKNGKIIIDFHNPKVNFFVFDEISKWFSLDAFDIDEFQIDLQNIWNVCKAKHPDFQAHALIQGCEDLGLSFLSLGQKKWLYGLGSGSKIFYETSPLDDFNLPKFSKII